MGFLGPTAWQEEGWEKGALPSLTVRHTSWKGAGHGSKEDLRRGLGMEKMGKSTHGKGEAEGSLDRRLHITGRVKEEE